MRRSPLARPLTAIVAAVLVSGALVGCSSFTLDGECEPAFQPGDASSAVTATGDVGNPPAVEFPTPLIAEETQRSVLVEGEGEPIDSDNAALLSATIFDAATSEVVAEGTVLFTANDSVLGISESLVCGTVGSRLAVVGTPTELGLTSTAEFVVTIIDIEQVFLGRANGVNQLPQDGMPTVVTAVDGTPGISVGYATVPSEARTAVIKAGAGATLADGDLVVYHLRTWTWPTDPGAKPSLVGDDTWASFQPAAAEISESELPYISALRGESVGSQLLIVTPGTDGGAATIYTVDILGILADE